jgi:hypothetical protein
MEHTDAIESNAAERYLLGEMSDDEQASFEQHYFDCRVCAADVTDGTRVMMAGRVVAAEEARTSNVVPMPVRRFQWLPAAAAASLIFGLLGTGIGYRAASRQPTALVRVVPIETGVSRAATPDEIPTVRAGDLLRFDIEPHDEAVRYFAVVACGGKNQSTDEISREVAAEAVSLQLGQLPAGRCELVIEGVRKDGNRFEITRSPFTFTTGEKSRVR